MSRDEAIGGNVGGSSWSRAIGLALAAVVVLSALAVGPVSAQENETFIVEQGSTCTEITPLGDGSQSASSYYDYRVLDPAANYSSFGTTDIQADQTSQVFVYRGSDGLSLVFLHDKINEPGGFVATADISGLPSDGRWTVEDDNYTGNDDVFDLGGSNAHIEWLSNGERTDGAVFTGLGSSGYSTITADIKFNDESNNYPFEEWSGSPSDNEIERFVARSGDGQTTELDMSQPVKISPGTCSGGVSTFTATQSGGTQTGSTTTGGATTAATSTQTDAATPTATDTAMPTATPAETTSAADGTDTEPDVTANAGTTDGGAGGGEGDTGVFGPGFGVLGVIAALAAIVLVTAALAVRRD